MQIEAFRTKWLSYPANPSLSATILAQIVPVLAIHRYFCQDHASEVVDVGCERRAGYVGYWDIVKLI
jgi:hypothetical protein